MSDELHHHTPDQAGLDAAAAELAAGGIVAIGNGLLTRVHGPDLCAGTSCWVHTPSTHGMNGWPVHWRQDKGTAERVCEHGIGHPDPDDTAFHARAGRDTTVHGCDGCCRR
ncbi:hypothetical protein ABIB15_002534 [Marisediminicola sp. UYEF4]|uniref:hypothetical protein n=1 Tax=Marisediminicola sp. UYEF4 TaxID=1756384 RepID=UPI00339A8CEB